MVFSTSGSAPSATADRTFNLGPDTGLHTLTAEFYCVHRQILASMSSPEWRLSDHLNSSAPTVDIQPICVGNVNEAIRMDLGPMQARVTKSRILMAIPIEEPRRPIHQQDPCRNGIGRDCWVGAGPYEVSGMLHTEVGRDPMIALSQQIGDFIPLTDVTVTFPDGRTMEYPTVLVNRSHLDMLAVGL